MFISVKAKGDISACSECFDHMDIDHNDLAKLIGRVVVDCINQVRAKGERPVVYSEYTVKLER